MTSEIKVNTIKDLGGNTIVSSNGSGTISGLPASAISSGTVATARLGSGTASSSTFLAGDSSYKTISGTTINTNADNRVITGSGTANTLNGEANLTFDGTALTANKVILTNSSGLTGGASSDGFITNADDTNTGIVFPDSDRIQFWTNDAERMRILNDGTVTINTAGGTIPSNLGGLHVQRGDGQNGVIFRGHSASTNYDSTLLMLTCARDAEGNEFNFFIGKNNNNDDKIIIRNDGDIQNVNNSYGAISDERFKQNITDASSQWDDIKALKIRNFQTKQEPTRTQLGVVAQEVEASGMNGLVDEVPPTESYVQYSSDFGTIEDGTADNGATPIKDDDGKITGYEDLFTEGQKVKSVKYSVLYMKAIKALQESMERIETLEAKVTALENA